MAFPLPAGMRDWLPRDAWRRAQLVDRVTESFTRYGYQRVEVPAFEYARVVEQGLGASSPRDALRFVEPETGEVVALRPDMTLQVARLVATRLAQMPPPIRLFYSGSVLRRPRARARTAKQLHQAGVELVGARAPAGDLELLELAASALRMAGLREFKIELGHVRIAGALLDAVPDAERQELMELLSVKDVSSIVRLAERVGLGAARVAALAELPHLHGADEVWPAAGRLLAGTTAEPAFAELQALWRLTSETELASKTLVDFGEVRNFDYYSGVVFQLLAEGPGAALGAGGRYDGLFDRFDVPRPAAGFGIDLANLDWARRLCGQRDGEPRRVLVSGESNLGAILDELRHRSVACARAPAGDSLSYAQAWGYSHLLEVREELEASLVALEGGGEPSRIVGDPAEIALHVATALGV